MGTKERKKVEQSTKKFVEDPGRVINAGLTGGFSEVGRSAINELTPPPPDMPNFNDPNVAQPSAEDANKALADDAALQEIVGGNRKRGRASTVLSGPQGLSGSTQYSARRTLLGV